MGNDWYSVPLAKCGEWLSGGTPSKQNDEYWAGRIPWVSPKDMYVGRIEDTEDHLTLKGLEAGSRCVPANTILFVVRSMTLRHTFQVAITNRDVSFNQDLKAIVPYDWVYPDFLYYTLKGQSDLILSLVDEASHGTTRLKTNTIGSLPIPFPPTFEEQVAIAQVVRSLDDKIEANRRQNETLEATARAIFQSWFVDFDPVHVKARGETPPGMDAETAALFPDSFEESELGLIPCGWGVKPLDEIASYLNGLALQKYPAEDETDFLPVIKIRELRQGAPDDNSNRASTTIPAVYVVNDGDVLFSWSGSLLVDIWTGGKGALNQHLFKVTSDRYPRWLYYFWTLFYLDEFVQIAADKATTMGHIKRHHLSDSLVVVPNDDILPALTAHIEPYIEAIVNNRIGSRTLAETRDALLPRLVSGELRVGESEDELA